MNILLLGNGFDLYHHLPTSYLCFLSVAKYLKEGKPATNIKEVFESTKSLCKQINESYDTYKSFYESYIFDEDDEKDIKEIRKIVKTNLWIEYFISAFNKDVGWIDFEKEIALVLKYFSDFLNTPYLYEVSKKDVKCNYKYYNHIITQFDFFFNLTPDRWLHVKDNFIIENPYGSGIYSIDKEKIYSYLYEELTGVSKALLLYMKIFIDEPLIKMKKDNQISTNPIFNQAGIIVNYNYTNTYETLYGSHPENKCKRHYHLHGSVDSEIVLGINPNEHDDIENINTSDIMFKKYYQRVYYGTDTNYSIFIGSVRSYCSNGRYDLLDNSIYNLIVCGHSLDITDKDTLSNILKISDTITIVYYKYSCIGDYIRNLVSMFGKEQFDQLRSHKRLQFLSYDEMDKSFLPNKKTK